MRSHLLLAALALVLAPRAVTAQGPWGNVQAWTGTITIEAADSGATQGGRWTLTYKATGPVTLADNMMPEGSHMLWPMAGAEDLSDPKKLEAMQKPWLARVTGRYEARGVDETGHAYSQSCVADTTVATPAGLTIDPANPTYVFQITPPRVKFACSGPPGTPTPVLNLPGSVSLTGPRGDPGPVRGTQRFTTTRMLTNVSFQLEPRK